MTIRELMAAIEAAGVSHDTEVYGARGPLRCVHVEDGVLVLDETAPRLVRKLTRRNDTEVVWEREEPATV